MRRRRGPRRRHLDRAAAAAVAVEIGIRPFDALDERRRMVATPLLATRAAELCNGVFTSPFARLTAPFRRSPALGRTGPRRIRATTTRHRFRRRCVRPAARADCREQDAGEHDPTRGANRQTAARACNVFRRISRSAIADSNSATDSAATGSRCTLPSAVNVNTAHK